MVPADWSDGGDIVRLTCHVRKARGVKVTMKNATLAISDIDAHAITECDGIFSSREQRSAAKRRCSAASALGSMRWAMAFSVKL